MFLTWLHYDVTRKKNLPCRSNNLRQKKKFFTYCLEIILKLPLQQNHISSRFFQGKTDSTIHDMSFFKLDGMPQNTVSYIVSVLQHLQIDCDYYSAGNFWYWDLIIDYNSSCSPASSSSGASPPGGACPW